MSIGFFEAVDDIADRASHVEILLWNIVQFAIKDAAETLHCIMKFDVTAFATCETLGYKHRLRQEVFDFPRPCDQ